MRAANDGVDADGFLRQVPRGLFQVEYRALLAAVRCQLPALLGRHLIALYVYGSVAEGRARPGQSDLDLTLVLSDACPAGLPVQLEQRRRLLECSHGEVSKIDFDIGRQAEVLAPGNRLSWGFWLRHHCRWLWGEDLARRYAPFKPEVGIAQAVNGDVLSVMRRYSSVHASCASPVERLGVQREAARRLLRALQVLRRPDETGWPWTLEDHYRRARRLHPAQRAALDFFYAEARQPQAAAAEFAQQLDAVLLWFECQLRQG
ncbi:MULTISPECIES: nucleotidyltransferase domain-containing protein [unclassified Pseudomonas]|uniref:nucleotidyltransferase domain-containing protein n=1 Tax=unclassified Pseudomonas TaxID=196821 RepID=UPI00131D2275|nr:MULTISPECIES: nucleotidyltransferase domain-containing protein [unclassified Pseudomonas]